MLQIIKARNGSNTLSFNNVFLHSRVNPGVEGIKLATTFLSKNPNIQKITVVGLGLGYHIIALLEKKISVEVYEPNPKIIQIALSSSPYAKALKNLKFINNINSLNGCFILPNYKQFIKLDNIKTSKQLNTLKGFSNIKVLCDFPIYGGSVTTAKYTLNAFKSIGCNVQYVNNQLANNLFQQFLQCDNKNELSLMLTQILSTWFYSHVQKFKPDICFFNAQSPITPQIITKLRKEGIICVFWFVEDYKRFNYYKSYAPLFDLFMVIQKDENFLSNLKSLNANYMYLPMAACDVMHKPIKLNDEEKNIYNCDIAFMGAGYLNRHNLFENFINYDLKIWGTDWDNNPKLKPFIQNKGKRVSIEETVKIYSNAKININIHSASSDTIFDENPDFINPRTFEIMACGGFQICDRRLLIPEIFVEDEEIVLFSSIKELKQKIEFYLNNPQKRQQIAKAGQQKVLKYHTYKNRLTAMFGVINKMYPQKFNQINNDAQKNTSLDENLNKFIEENFDNSNFDVSKASEIILNKTSTLKKHEAIILMLNEYLQMKKG